MEKTVTLVNPSAPAPVQASDTAATQRTLNTKGLRIGVLDNSKSNADHLLAMVIEGVRAALPVASVVSLRKPYVALPAPIETLDQLAREADFVFSAMAD